MTAEIVQLPCGFRVTAERDCVQYTTTVATEAEANEFIAAVGHYDLPCDIEPTLPDRVLP